MRQSTPTARRWALVLPVTVALLVLAVGCGLAVGPTPIGVGLIGRDLLAHLGLGHSPLTQLQSTIVWQLRAPRLVLGLLVGATLATSGAAYQGVFRNPLADPYLLGVAAGAGLGATLAITRAGHGLMVPAWTPWAAFGGALVAVGATWLVGGRGASASPATLILAGIAVASLLTAAQTFLQQQASAQSIASVYLWLLGSLATASWSSVVTVLPYVAVTLITCLAASRALDVMSVGDDEARSLGLNVGRVRLVVVVASSLGTAAVVSVSGLIGFVGIVVPHLVRLSLGVSYRRIIPAAAGVGAAFLVLADTVARTILAPTELPLGVVTAVVGAPVFVLLLAKRRPS
jgi:iron complex transport system permease protein